MIYVKVPWGLWLWCGGMYAITQALIYHTGDEGLLLARSKDLILYTAVISWAFNLGDTEYENGPRYLVTREQTRLVLKRF